MTIGDIDFGTMLDNESLCKNVVTVKYTKVKRGITTIALRINIGTP